MMEDKWMLRKEAAEYLGISVSALAHMACDGRGPTFYRAGKLTRYKQTDLDAWASGRRHDPLPAELQPFLKQRRGGRSLAGL